MILCLTEVPIIVNGKSQGFSNIRSSCKEIILSDATASLLCETGTVTLFVVQVHTLATVVVGAVSIQSCSFVFCVLPTEASPDETFEQKNASTPQPPYTLKAKTLSIDFLWQRDKSFVLRMALLVHQQTVPLESEGSWFKLLKVTKSHRIFLLLHTFMLSAHNAVWILASSENRGPYHQLISIAGPDGQLFSSAIHHATVLSLFSDTFQ